MKFFIDIKTLQLLFHKLLNKKLLIIIKVIINKS